MESSVKDYLLDLKSYLQFLKERSVAPAAATMEDVLTYLTYLHQRRLTGATIGRRLTVIRLFHRFLVRNGKADQDPTLHISGPKLAETIPLFLTLEEMDHLLNDEQPLTKDPDLSLRNQTILELFYACGLRVGELVGLKVDQVDLETGFVRVMGKGGKERLVPLGRSARQAIAAYLNQVRAKWDRGRSGGVLMITKKGLPLRRETVIRIVERYALWRIGKKISPHKIRHTFATHLLYGGAGLRVIQELLGHSQITTTQRYTHIARLSQLKETHRQSHPLGEAKVGSDEEREPMERQEGL